MKDMTEDTTSSLLTLTDSKLAALHRQAANEMARRSKAAACGRDAAAIICGNEMAKRALVVAAAGGHSILFVGPHNCGKTMLRAAALELGLGSTFEALPCPCGHRSSPIRSCKCTAAEIDRCLAAWPVADITVEVPEPPQRELNGRPGTTLVDMQSQVARASAYTDLTLDQDSAAILKSACVELGIDPDGRQRIIAVARTIANLENCQRIESRHVCEATNYRMFRR
jgi:predicted ATPase with chaperone activity